MDSPTSWARSSRATISRTSTRSRVVSVTREKKEDWLRDFPLRALVVEPTGETVTTFQKYEPPVDPDASLDHRSRLLDEAETVLCAQDLRSRWGTYRDLHGPGFDELLAKAASDTNYARVYRSLLEPMDVFMSDVENLALGWPTSLRWGYCDARATLGRFSLFYNMTGYGFTREVPAIYPMKFFRMVSNVGLRLAVGGHPLTTARAGFQQLFKRLAEVLEERGVELRLGHTVRKVRRPSDKGWTDALDGARGVEVEELLPALLHRNPAL